MHPYTDKHTWINTHIILKTNKVQMDLATTAVRE